MSERVIVVSTDCHAGLPIADYKPYVESRYHPMLEMAVPMPIPTTSTPARIARAPTLN